ncbi:MAG: hypothetical protein APR55_07645 [Methanolinea sp. SDB]|nr:MAG: hypothetical protein APR55_07645 [Methanolinea sp. SDB]
MTETEKNPPLSALYGAEISLTTRSGRADPAAAGIAVHNDSAMRKNIGIDLYISIISTLFVTRYQGALSLIGYP